MHSSGSGQEAALAPQQPTPSLPPPQPPTAYQRQPPEQAPETKLLCDLDALSRRTALEAIVDDPADELAPGAFPLLALLPCYAAPNFPSPNHR